MLFFRKLFKLPGPKELGVSAHDALELREFSPDTEGYCWEDYHVDVKKKYPIRYFFAETLADFIRYKIWFKIARPISDLKYWLVSHCVPSRRYHMLDLRQPCNNKNNYDCYRYGFVNTSDQMLYAMFNLLDQFVKHEMESFYCPSEEEIIKSPELQSQRDLYFEILAIHRWWFEEKLESMKIEDDFLSEWSNARKDIEKRKNGEAEKLFNQLQKIKEDRDAKLEEIISRLMKIRKSLWT